MTRRTVFLIAALVPAFAVPADAQDTLVTIRGLGPRTLRTQYFALDTDQQVHITAVGGEPQGRSAVRRFLDNGVFQSKEQRQWDQDVWPGNAWLLDSRTREVVWELRTAPTRSDGGGLREFDGLVRLKAGSYEMYYSALYPVSRFWTDEEDWRVRTDAQPAVDRLHGPYIDDGSYRSFRVVLSGSGHRLTREAAEIERNRESLLALRGTKPKARERIGFELDRAMDIEVYLLGESDGTWNDYGWIMNAADRRIVWTAKNESGSNGGGAQKNRMVRRTMNLPAGKYVALYSTDNAHELSAWNETPPADPFSWGMTVRVINPADRAAARTFAYQPIPTADAFVTLTKLGNNELRWQRFNVTRPVEVRTFSVGEGSGGDLSDYGWIVDQAGRSVWRMTYEETEEAGGSRKNRVSTGTLRLAPGTYTAYFSTDGSHSFADGWNAEEPMDAEYWGLSVAPATPRDAAAISRLDDVNADPAVLARVTGVRPGRTGEARFTLARRSPVRIYAIGEGNGEMFDYAMIQDSTGQDVWRMTYGETEPAGGAQKNRRADRTLTLEAGAYVLRFKTDDTHGWQDWNAELPDDPAAYGVTVSRPQLKP